MLSAQMGAAPTRAAPKRSGRRPLHTDTLLSVAVAYAKAAKAGSARPVEDAAQALAMTVPRARDLVYKARQRGLLTPADWGLPGGELTPQATALLAEQRQRTPSRSRRRKRA
jgi:hypothetical protein